MVSTSGLYSKHLDVYSVWGIGYRHASGFARVILAQVPCLSSVSFQIHGMIPAGLGFRIGLMLACLTSPAFLFVQGIDLRGGSLSCGFEVLIYVSFHKQGIIFSILPNSWDDPCRPRVQDRFNVGLPYISCLLIWAGDRSARRIFELWL